MKKGVEREKWGKKGWEKIKKVVVVLMNSKSISSININIKKRPAQRPAVVVVTVITFGKFGFWEILFVFVASLHDRRQTHCKLIDKLILPTTGISINLLGKKVRKTMKKLKKIRKRKTKKN